MIAAKKLHYAWTVAAVTFVVLWLAAGIRAAPGVLIVPFEHDFHWSRATISLAIGVNLLLYGAVGPFAAVLMDRWGPRRVMTLALTLTAAALAATPAMRQPWQLILLWGVVVGSGCGVVGNYLAAFIATRWFDVRQGLIIGVLTASNAAGQLVFLPSLAGLVSIAGWRVMSFSLAGIVIVFVPLVALLMRNRPEDLGLSPLGGKAGAPATRRLAGNPAAIAFRALADAGRSRDFWLLAGAYFICGATTNGLVGTHLIPACVDHGIAEVTGAGILAATAVFSFAGGTLSGLLSDRWDNRTLLASYYGLRGVALIYLPFALGTPYFGLPVFAVLYGLDWIASVPPTVRLLTRIFGVERVAIMVAWITVVHQMGAASAAYLGGVLRVVFGTYLEAFVFAGLLCFAAALMALLVGLGRGGAQAAPALAAE